MKFIKPLLTGYLAFIFIFVLAMANVNAKDPATGPYSYPFAARDLKKELGNGPLLLELFSTQACVFCPTADKFFADLMTHSNIIGLACHVDYFDVKKGSLAKSFCTQRQNKYAELLPDTMVYTPQMVVNGRRDAVGYEYEDVLQLLLDAAKNPPSALVIKNNKNGSFSVDMTKIKLQPQSSATVMVATYDSPYTIKIASGANRGQTQHYPRIVSEMVELQAWDGAAGTLKFDWSPKKNQKGLVLFVQAPSGAILAVGQYEPLSLAGN